jgi:hypothetical protein
MQRPQKSPSWARGAGNCWQALVIERLTFFRGASMKSKLLGLKNVTCAAAVMVVALVVSVPRANAVPLISNGSFETPVVSAGSFTSFGVGSALLTGWSVVGPADTVVSVVSGTFSQNGVTFQQQDGIQWLDLTGVNSNSTEGVSQTLATTAGHVYQLSFYVGNTTGGSIFGSTSTVNVSINGTPTFSDTNSTTNATGLSWELFTHTFIASATTTLAFLNGDPANDNSNGLDNVVLNDLGPAAVPLPAALPLFATGLGALGLLGWRRKRNATAVAA